MGVLIDHLFEVIHRAKNLFELDLLLRGVDCFLDTLPLTIEVKKGHATCSLPPLHIHGRSMDECYIDITLASISVLLKLVNKCFLSFLRPFILVFYILLQLLNFIIQLLYPLQLGFIY